VRDYFKDTMESGLAKIMAGIATADNSVSEGLADAQEEAEEAEEERASVATAPCMEEEAETRPLFDADEGSMSSGRAAEGFAD
jgi:hypothetical protein